MLDWLAKSLPGRAILTFLSCCSTEQLVSPALSQLAYQGIRQDVEYKIYIYAKEPLGSLRWRFQIKMVGFYIVTMKEVKPYYSSWEIADCADSTIDGRVVSAIARSGVEAGQA